MAAKLSVYAHPGTEAWAITSQDAQRIAGWLDKDVRVEYWPRDMVAQVWARDKHTDDAAASRTDLSFRGYSFATKEAGNMAVVFVDHLEDYESATFVTLHELAHLHLPPWSPAVQRNIEQANAEEDRADAVAGKLMKELLGYREGVYEVCVLRENGRQLNPRPRCCPLHFGF